MVRSGYVWFAAQGLIAGALLAAPIFSRAEFPVGARAFGVVLGLCSLALVVSSYRALGSSHSPWTEPRAGATLVTRGPYAVVRHPVYLGYVVGGFGYGLLFGSPLALFFAILCFLYYDLRTRWEDRELARCYAEFTSYKRMVRGRLIPLFY